MKVTLDTVFYGDCLKLLQSMEDRSVQLVVSSPPYNLGKEYEARKALEQYLEEQETILAECVRVLADTGSLVWQVGAFSDKGCLIPLDIRFFPILESLGMIPRNRIVWVRQHGLHARNKFSCRHETLLWFTKTDDYIFNLDPIRVPQKYKNKKSHRKENHGELTCNPNGKNPGDIWMFRNVKHNHEEQTIHPCQFPEDLIARLVLALTDEDDTVFDPYMGAGTAAVVARDLRRHYLGAETDDRYYEAAIRRIAGCPNQDGMFANLKTLRDYAEKTGEPIEKFGFDVQVGRKPTARGKSRIYSEQHHLQEMERRLSFEEECFASDIRGEPQPDDYFAGGAVKPRNASDGERHKQQPLFAEE